ncbi:hypothetical protein VIGAN_06264100 [Vigna angularis var. angularis]|uniref:Uncharacterized protein n=1 Tax=Vigna angularis var. angularis TaxID=157739 RepID=A0A0S3SEZ3_PHAAN|nr:hypothetical protein VIGAN_06264100 [Vigna angularis var. angularis]
MGSKNSICVVLFLCLIFSYSTKRISAANKLGVSAAASEQNAGSDEMSESRKLLGTGQKQRPKCTVKQGQEEGHSKDKPICHNYL